jgi:hypothetical protein
VILEGDADIRDRLRNDRVADTDVTGRLLEQAGHHQHQRALAAPGRTHDGDELAGGDSGANRLQRLKRRVGILAEHLRDIANGDRNARVDLRSRGSAHDGVTSSSATVQSIDGRGWPRYAQAPCLELTKACAMFGYDLQARICASDGR